jgi:hypothetical protein
MASIDKIYGTAEEFEEFKDWMKKNNKDACKYLYYPDDDTWETEWNDDKTHPMSNFPEEIDIWLYKNCPLDFIVERIAEQYGEDWTKEQTK